MRHHLWRQQQQLLRVLLVTLLPAAFATDSFGTLPPGPEGCVYYGGYGEGERDNGQGLLIPSCVPGGNGCYECCVPLQNTAEWWFCTEVEGANGPIDNCSSPQPWFPDWWPDPNANNWGFGDPGLPGEVPPWAWTDDAGSTDYGGGGGSGCIGGGWCHQKYLPPPRRYSVPPGPHRPYRG
jgi:hypothetical protein